MCSHLYGFHLLIYSWVFCQASREIRCVYDLRVNFTALKNYSYILKNLVSETRSLRNILLLNLTSEDLLSNLLVCPVWVDAETGLRLDSLEHCMPQRPTMSPAVTPLAWLASTVTMGSQWLSCCKI